MHIRKKDKVKVISGNHRGKTGEVLKVFPGSGKIIVEKVNLIKRHTRPSQQNQRGGIVEKEAPINVSNVMLICPKCDAASRTGQVVLSDGSRVRSCRKCGEMLAD
ncbi:MAG: 50S ribosomal protein L24 [bacterium]